MKYLIANWKMNSVDLDSWENNFINYVNSSKSFPKPHELKIVLCSNLYDFYVLSEKIKNSKNDIFKNITLYSQDVSQHEEGAFTGQVSSKFLKRVGL